MASIASVYVRPWLRSAYRRADPRLPHRMVPAYPPFGAFGFTTYGIGSPRCSLSDVVHFMQVSKWLGHYSFVPTLTTYADYISEDELAAPKLARPVAGAAEKVVPLQGKAR